jgi:parvulin-like peptidyl-prolyl isomerase
LREKLGEALAAEVPTTDEHVHAYHILVEDEKMAAEVLEKLNAGADFAGLVAEYSQDEDTVDRGGELGWLAKGQRGVSVTLVDAAFALQPGEISEAIETYEGYHIVTIDERRADYPLDEGTLEWRKTQAFDEWLTEAKQTADIQRTWSTEDVPTG